MYLLKLLYCNRLHMPINTFTNKEGRALISRKGKPKNENSLANMIFFRFCPLVLAVCSLFLWCSQAWKVAGTVDWFEMNFREMMSTSFKFKCTQCIYDICKQMYCEFTVLNCYSRARARVCVLGSLQCTLIITSIHICWRLIQWNAPSKTFFSSKLLLQKKILHCTRPFYLVCPLCRKEACDLLCGFALQI